jgi:hypothetical protein
MGFDDHRGRRFFVREAVNATREVHYWRHWKHPLSSTALQYILRSQHFLLLFLFATLKNCGYENR